MTRSLAMRIAALLILLFPMVGLSSEPIPSPSHGFEFDGSVRRASAGPIKNYTVIAMAWRQDGHRVGFCGGLEDLLPSQPFDLTNDSGKFSVYFWTCGVPDTLSVAVISPDTTIMGTIVPMNSLRGAYEEIDGNWKSGGDGCSSPTSTHYVQGYIFDADSLVINVP